MWSATSGGISPHLVADHTVSQPLIQCQARHLHFETDSHRSQKYLLDREYSFTGVMLFCSSTKKSKICLSVKSTTICKCISSSTCVRLFYSVYFESSVRYYCITNTPVTTCTQIYVYAQHCAWTSEPVPPSPLWLPCFMFVRWLLLKLL